MADNVAITAGAGTSVATDDVSSVHYQKVKLDGGGDGVALPIIAGQQTMANSLPVAVASNQSALPITLSTPAVTTGNITAVDVSAGSHNPPTTNSYVQVTATGYDLVALLFTGTYTSVSISYEASMDNTNWFAIYGKRETVDRWDSSSGTQTNLTRTIFIPTCGAVYIRVRCTAFSSGTMAITMALSNTASSVLCSFQGGGDVPSAIADAGNPVKIGGRASTTEQTAVSTAQRVNAQFDITGKLITLPGSIPELFVSGVTAAMTGTGDTTLLAAAGASTRNFVTAVTLTNSHASVSTLMELKDNTTVVWRVWVPFGTSHTIIFPTPLRGSANVAFNVANVTTGSNTYASATGYKGV